MIVRSRKAVALRGFLAACQTIAVFGASSPAQVCLKLAWDPSPTPGIVGYRVYAGGACQTYTNVLDAGSQTSAAVCGLTVGATYFFAVTAYATNGIESPFSGEISYTVPPTAALAKLKLLMLPGKQVQLSGSGPIGYQYQVLSARNWTNWSAIGSVTIGTNGSFQFTAPGAGTNGLHSYRLRQTYP